MFSEHHGDGGSGGGGLVSKSCPTLATLWTAAHQAPLSMDSPGKNTGVGCHFLLQGIFPTQESNPVSCITGRFFYRLSYEGGRVKTLAPSLSSVL